MRICAFLVLLLSVAAHGQGKLSGVMFGDYYYNLHRDAASASFPSVASPSGPTAYQAFQFRRIYFAYDNDLSEHFSTRFRLEADQAANASNGAIGVAVKDAFLRCKNVFEGSDVFIGVQPTPAFEVSEGVWGYRSLEKTIMDLRGIVSSRDLGISLRGSLTGGTLGYWILLGNGSGNKPETDKYKRLYGQLYFKASNLQVTAAGDVNGRSKVSDPFHSGTKVSNETVTASAFAGYSEEEKYTVGAEGFTQSTSHGYNNGNGLVTKTAMGFSIFGSCYLQADLALILRYDYYNPNRDTKVTGGPTNYVITGISWRPEKKVMIIPNVLYESYEAQSGAASRDASVTGRVTFSCAL